MKHQDAAAREHRRRFRIDGVKGHLRLKTALATIEENEESLQLALESSEEPGHAWETLGKVKAALRLLAEGSSGEFR